jgi:hypothetical protein
MRTLAKMWLVIPSTALLEPFRLHYWLSAGGASFDCGQAHATLSFGGLPAGARIESCHGFQQDIPVSAEATTWGAIKARYRGQGGED